MFMLSISVYVSMYPFVYLPVYPSTYRTIYLPAYLPTDPLFIPYILKYNWDEAGW